MEPHQHIPGLSHPQTNFTNYEFVEAQFLSSNLDLSINFTSGRFEWNDTFYVFLWEQDAFGRDHAESLCQSFSPGTHLANIPNEETLDILKDVMVAILQVWEYGISSWIEGSTMVNDNEYLEFEYYEETRIQGTFG